MCRGPYLPQSHKELEGVSGPDTAVVFHSQDEEAHRDEDEVARRMKEDVRLLCWIMTGPQNHEAKVRKM